MHACTLASSCEIARWIRRSYRYCRENNFEQVSAIRLGIVLVISWMVKTNKIWCTNRFYTADIPRVWSLWKLVKSWKRFATDESFKFFQIQHNIFYEPFKRFLMYQISWQLGISGIRFSGYTKIQGFANNILKNNGNILGIGLSYSGVEKVAE